MTTFEEFHAGTPQNGPERLRAFEALPKRLQRGAWHDLREELLYQRVLAGDLDWPIPEGSVREFKPIRVTVDTAIEFIPPPTYFKALAGIEVPGNGRNVPCPLPGHEDSDPSCQVWSDVAKGWFCHACRVGGTIYDLAGALWELPTRGESFKTIKHRLEDHFGLAADPVQSEGVGSGQGLVLAPPVA